jgi:Methyltransferase small domain
MSGASSASTAHSLMAGMQRPPTSPGAPAPPSVTRASGSSSRPSPDSCRSTTRTPGPASAATGCPPAYRPVFVDEEDLNHLTPLATLAIAVCGPMGALLDAYRTGGGVPYEAYDLHEAIGAINRPQFVNLAGDWLASIPEVDARLRAQPPARVADLACGTAWSSIAIARAYPGVTVDAIDVDDASIKTAHANVVAAGLADSGAAGRPRRERAGAERHLRPDHDL